MKKRVLSILLVSIMLLSMLPITASAEASTAPELKMHKRVWNNGKEGVQVVTEDDYPIDSWLEAKFFLHYPDGTTSQLNFTQLGFTDELNCMGVNDEGWIRIQTAAIGRGQVVYQAGSATYTVDIDVTYPNLGIYTAKPFDAKSLTDTVTVDSADCVFYIALSPEMKERGRVMTKVHSAFDSETDDPSITTIGTVELSDDRSYAAVTVTNAQAEGEYYFEAEVANKNPNGGPCGTLNRTVSIENNTPRLYYCNADRNDETESWEIRFEDPKSTWYTTPDTSKIVAFFFGRKSDIRDGNLKPLPPEDLRFNPDLDADDFEGDDYTVPANILRVECTDFNTKPIRYTTGGETYYIEVVNTLPEFGFYNEPTPREDTYIYNQNPFTVTKSNRVFYLLPNDPKNIRFVSIKEWYDESVKDLFDVSVENGAVEFRVKDGAIVPNEAVGIEIQYEVKRHSDSWETRSRSVEVWLKNGQPALMYRRLEWDDEEQEWYEPKSHPLETRLNITTGDNFPVQFYYGTEDDKVKVELDELSFPKTILRGYEEEHVLRLNAVGFNETGAITYTNGDDDTATMQVRVDQPPYALYDSMTASKATYLGDDITLGGKGYPEVYLIAASGQTISQIDKIRSGNRGEDVTEKFKVQLAGDGSYAILRLNENDLPAGNTDYDIRISNMDRGHFFHINFMLNRGDLEQLATPTNLVWHKQYAQWYDQEEKKMNLITEDRMGCMGFEVHGLCQNRAEVEIYSSDDGYTFPVSEGSWSFGDMEDRTHFSVTDFIYDDLPSGTYKFRVRAKGDGTKYRDSEWSEWSSEFIYKKPTSQLTAPEAAGLIWKKNEDGHYIATWPLEAGQQDGVGYFEVRFYHTNENGEKRRNSSSRDIWVNDHSDQDFYDVWIHDEILEEHGAVPYYFKVRVIPADITQYRISEWSDFSEALDTQTVTDRVNQELDDLLSKKLDVEKVQNALETQTGDLHTAMAADLELSGGASSGTLEKIRELESKVADSVTQGIKAKNNAPQQIKDIAGGITMIGATLNLADKHPESGTKPTVTLELDEPKSGVVIAEQQHNAVQFSMKLNGAVDKDDKEKAGQQLIVPVVIDMPVPAGINPDFLVVLHKLWDGTIEQIRPYIYWNESSHCRHARFVIDSFSDFALVEYNFRFEADSVTKVLGDAPFAMAATGNAEGSSVTYSSSDSSVAKVNPETGRVTMLKAGAVTITATAAATEVYPEAQASYVLTVTASNASRPSVSVPSTSKIQVEQPQNGAVSLSSNSAAKGDTVTITVMPDKGYTLETLTVTDENGKSVPVRNNGDGTYSFTQPAGKVTITATFMEDNSMLNFFVDVPASAYYYDAVLWAAENGITGGTGDGLTFSPNATCTRAQAVTFLWRAAGCPEPETMSSFADASADSYYAKAVAWAVENGITKGTGDGTTFSPNATCTRGQIMTFLWRAQKSPAAAGANSFTDMAADSYCANAVQWAVENGITNGTGDGTTFSPNNNCTRAQIVTFLYRFFVK